VIMLAAVAPGAGLLVGDAVRRRRGRRPRHIERRGRRPRHIERRGRGRPGESREPDPVPLTRQSTWREAERLVS
jgi:hypothetical protein